MNRQNVNSMMELMSDVLDLFDEYGLEVDEAIIFATTMLSSLQLAHPKEYETTMVKMKKRAKNFDKEMSKKATH